MKKILLRTARTTVIVLLCLQGMLVGSPLAGPVLVLAAFALYHLVDYGAREVERALDAASGRRIAELTWELQTRAATQALQERRFVADLENVLAPRPPKPTPVVYQRADGVDEVLFTDGGLLCIPSELRLHRYAS